MTTGQPPRPLQSTRRWLLLLPWAMAGRARAAWREVDDLGLAIELPDPWVPIPRAEILEARERAIAAGAATDWTVRAAWQPPPHLRWFTLPHLALESRAVPDGPATAARVEHLAGRAGARVVHTHRATWRHEGLELRLGLLSLEDLRDEFERWVSSLRGRSAPQR